MRVSLRLALAVIVLAAGCQSTGGDQTKAEPNVGGGFIAGVCSLLFSNPKNEQIGYDAGRGGFFSSDRSAGEPSDLDARHLGR